MKFKDPAVLRQALVHSSYVNENPELAPASNERLEFLGDAVLGLVVAHDLYTSFPDEDEGKLTELRAHLVRRDTLATAAYRLQLGAELLLGRGEDVGGGRDRPTNLAHAYEAVVGAIFLDSGFASARSFVRRSLRPELQTLTEGAFPLDPKSRLQEITQARYQSTPLYRLIAAKGPDHAREYTVEVVIDGRSFGTGEGSSKQQAEKAAAQQALARFDEHHEEATGMSSACT